MEEQLLQLLAMMPSIAGLAYAVYVLDKRLGECMAMYKALAEKHEDGE